MTTDITELEQSLKAAANTTADAIDRLKEFPGDELIDLSQHEGEQVDIDITTLNEWYELSSPANILALVEALETAQQRNSYLETYSKTAIEFREAARDENRRLKLDLEIAEKRVAELEKAQQLATQQGNIACALFDEVTAQRQRIAELESRTVTVKLPSLNPAMFNGDVMFGYRKAQKEAVEFCAAAGIKVEVE